MSQWAPSTLEWISANAGTLSALGAVSSAAAAIAAFWAALSTAKSVREMRSARLQSCRPHFIMTLGAPISVKGSGGERPIEAAIFKNVGSGTAKSVFVSIYADTKKSVDLLLKSGALTKFQTQTNSHLSTYLFSVKNENAREGGTMIVRGAKPRHDIKFSVSKLGLNYSQRLGDCAEREKLSYTLSVDQLLEISTLPIASGIYGASGSSAMLQLAYTSMAGEFLIQEFWLAAETSSNSGNVTIALREGIHSRLFPWPIGDLRRRRREARRWLRASWHR